MGPGGNGTLVLFVLAFAGFAFLLASRRHLVLRLVGGVLAFAMAAGFGVTAVNAYFGYYETWAALSRDVRNDHSTVAPVVLPGFDRSAAGSPSARPAGAALVAAPTTGTGRIARLTYGPASSPREMLAYLPPQYDQPGFETSRFPVMVFLHGEPGDPAGLLDGLGLPGFVDTEIGTGRAGPMVVLMPDIRGSMKDQQCLNDDRGVPLETLLTTDLQAAARGALRVLPPGKDWVVAGLSEGGFCAADLALRYPKLFAGAGVMDGTFHPDTPQRVRQRALHNPAEIAAHDPVSLVQGWPAGTPLPAFWVMAGTGNGPDYAAATSFVELLLPRQKPRFVTVLKGQHLTPAFRAGVPDLYQWAWSVVQGRPTTGQLAVPL